MGGLGLLGGARIRGAGRERRADLGGAARRADPDEVAAVVGDHGGLLLRARGARQERPRLGLGEHRPGPELARAGVAASEPARGTYWPLTVARSRAPAARSCAANPVSPR